MQYHSYFVYGLKSIGVAVLINILYNTSEAYYRMLSAEKQEEQTFLHKSYLAVVNNLTLYANTWITVIFANYVK